MSLFRIGTRYYGRSWYFAGVIDHVAVRNAPLSAAIIAAHAARGGIDVTHPNLKGYWRFDEGTGATAADLAQGNNASVRGARWVARECVEVQRPETQAHQEY